MSIKTYLSTIFQTIGAAVTICGLYLYSPRLAVLCGGIILTLFGIALERGAQ